MSVVTQSARRQDAALRRRAAAVIPGGMYGHQDASQLPSAFPQFFERAEGSHIWDCDGHEYVDLMCSWGPILLGHKHPKVEQAAAEQRAKGDCQNGPGRVMVELAELLVERISHADWAMFAKNGTDVTTTALMVARAATGRRKFLAARRSYHGSAPWCTPRLDGTAPGDRENIVLFEYNDIPSVIAAAEIVGDDLAGVIVTPHRHDAGYDQELVDPAFARSLRELCDRSQAALILDEVRCGLRLHEGGSWVPIGVEPDLSTWSKGIANGHALSALLGNDQFRDGARRLFVTGSFWFSAASMAAAIATLHAHHDEGALERMERAGSLLRSGLDEQAHSYDLKIRQTGPVQMPFLTFADDKDYERARLFAATALTYGAYLHPMHNWFLSAAHTDGDMQRVLEATDHAFRAVHEKYDRN